MDRRVSHRLRGKCPAERVSQIITLNNGSQAVVRDVARVQDKPEAPEAKDVQLIPFEVG